MKAEKLGLSMLRNLSFQCDSSDRRPLRQFARGSTKWATLAIGKRGLY
jgi:hypothetical protein